MSKMSTLFSATMPIKLLVGACLLVCVAAVPFGAADRADESARTLAFAGRLLEVGKERWAVEGQAQLAVSTVDGALHSVAVAPRARPQGGGSEPATSGGTTVCPVSHTSCPQESTVCPTLPTNCPVHQTVCVTTQCPTNPTICPEQATTCQYTVCPTITTSCPTLATACPQSRTVCPTSTTRCPVNPTTCPNEWTVCNTWATHCPKDPTVCEHTVCPANPTHCPIVATQCDFTTCNTDSESSCSSLPACWGCGISYDEGPPVGFVEPSRVAGAIPARGEGTTAPAPRLTFL